MSYIKDLEEYLKKATYIEVEEIVVEDDTSPIDTEMKPGEDMPEEIPDKLIGSSPEVVGKVEGTPLKIKPKKVTDNRKRESDGSLTSADSYYVWNSTKKCLVKRKKLRPSTKKYTDKTVEEPIDDSDDDSDDLPF